MSFSVGCCSVAKGAEKEEKENDRLRLEVGVTTDGWLLLEFFSALLEVAAVTSSSKELVAMAVTKLFPASSLDMLFDVVRDRRLTLAGTTL